MRKKRDEPTIKEKLSTFLDVPKEVGAGLNKITLVGNNELTIENYKGIIEYDMEVMKINTGTYIVRVQGNQLEIQAITDEAIIIRGKIKAIELT